MDVSIHDGDDVCWLCSIPTSHCDCEASHSPWSKPISPESFKFPAFNDGEELVRFNPDEPTYCTINGDYFLAGAFELPDRDFEILVHARASGVVPLPGLESQHPYAVSTPRNDEEDKWRSPGALGPPESSSPVCFDTDSSPLTWTPCREGLGFAADQPLPCSSPGNEQWHVETLFNCCADQQVPGATSVGDSLNMNFSTFAQGSVKGQDAGESRDICAPATRQSSIGTNHPKKCDRVNCVSASGNLVPPSCTTCLPSGPTIPDLTTWAQLESVSSHGMENNESYNASTTSNDMRRDDSFSLKMPLETSESLTVDSYLEQAPMNNNLKRRRSSFGCFHGLKKAKPEPTASHVSHSGNSNLRFKYQATKPASLRRAESLQSEISACSEGSFDSRFNPSPLSPPTFRLDEYPSTLPSTPLPSAVDQARSKANPLARTLAVCRHKSQDVPAIPPVPIIAPPSDVLPPVIHGAEDYAIDRLEALLLRERLERERDGLDVHDKERAERLIAIHGTDHPISPRSSASTSNSSDDDYRWEDETTYSATESQESQQLARSMKIQVLSEQHRLASREIWASTYGISDCFRQETTRWILEKVPKEPEPSLKNAPSEERPHGTDLYDQLMYSSQTRFHAAQLFHRYFLLSEKVEYWREACDCEFCFSAQHESCDDLDNERGVWHLAAACIALGVKLHRDCLHPLRPVFSAEFLAMARYPMTHETFELAQRNVLYSCQFQLGSCTPQDVLDELWNALPTLRRATRPVGWAIVQCVTWEELFKSLLEPDMLQYPITLLTAAALIDSLAFALARHYKKEEEASICKYKATYHSQDECDDTVLWQIHLFEANQLVNDVILDIRDVLHLSPMELDECRKWLSHIGQL